MTNYLTTTAGCPRQATTARRNYEAMKLGNVVYVLETKCMPIPFNSDFISDDML